MKAYMPYINIHTHRDVYQDDVLSVVSQMAGGFEEKAVNNFFSLGIHPWQLESISPDLLKTMMLDDLRRCSPVAIGEAGFDRSVNVPIQLQQEIVVFQEEIAARMQLPLIYHAVRAGDLLLARAKALPRLNRIIHGYAGNPGAAHQLLNAGFSLSFGSALFDTRRHAAESIRFTAIDQLFLETDESVLSIQEVYARAAFLRGETPEHLRNAIFANFVRIFNIQL